MAKNKRRSNSNEGNNFSDKIYTGLKKTGKVIIAATEVVIAVGGAKAAYDNLKGKK